MPVPPVRLAIAAAIAVSTDVATSAPFAGADSSGAVPGTPRGAAATIDIGGDHTCVRLANGDVTCWGANNNGQLGRGDDTPVIGDEPGEMGNALVPVDLGTGRTATAITAGTGHTCALLDDATVKCWGNGGNGRLGQGTTADIGDQPGQLGDNLAAVDLGTGRTATAITAGANHTCALLDDATVKCWGNGGNGRLGQGTTADIGDQPGQLGDNLAAVDLGTGRTATAITAGTGHTCALLDTGQVKCWGSGSNGKLGQGTTATVGDDPGEMGDALPTVNLGGGLTATAISAGPNHTCALLDTNRVKCWGWNVFGQLGQGDTTTVGEAPGQMGDSLDPIDLGVGSGSLVVPVTAPPAAPTAVSATAGGPVTVAWTAPDDDGGAPVTGYRIQHSTNGVTWATTVDDTGTTATTRQITGFGGGDTVRFRVAAINTIGVGVVSLASAPITLPDYVALDPARLLDTRDPGGTTIDGLFAASGKLTGGNEIALPVAGRGGVPTDAEAAVLNITVNDPDAAGFITAYPCGTPRPDASNLNYVAGQTIPNNTIVKLGTSGTICLYSDQTTNLIADVNGHVG